MVVVVVIVVVAFAATAVHCAILLVSKFRLIKNLFGALLQLDHAAVSV